VVGIELLTADGAVRWLSLGPDGDADAFRAAQVSVGALGVVSAVRLQCVPLRNLRIVEADIRLDEIADRFDELVATNEVFEFSWRPGAPVARSRRANPVEGPPRRRSRSRAWYEDVGLERVSAWVARRDGRPFAGPGAAAVGLLPGRSELVERSDRVLCAARRRRPGEREYGVALDAAPEVLGALRALGARGGAADGDQPVEVRVGRADDCWLSTAYGRATCFIAWPAATDAFSDVVERLLEERGGRPHWGLAHDQTAETLAGRFPEWSRFAAVRARLDPDGVFANDYTERLLGPVI